jgi:hypothetical protein
MTSFRIAGALTAAAALAAPASALAHGSVFETEARLGAGPEVQKQYLVTNHGFTFALKESNGATDQGMINYKALPKAYRDTLTKTELLAQGSTGAQPHATCRGVAALDEASVLAWQGADPFYAYVPWQKGSAGLEDDPATWIAVVKDRTGVDLTTADPATSCAAEGGTYTPADETVSTAKALAAGTVEEETAPLTGQIASLTKSLTDAEAAKVTLQALLDAAKAELAKLATPVTVALPSAKLEAATFAKQGTPVTVGGVAGSPVRVQLTIGEGQARKLKLKSSVLASGKATLGGTGAATLVLKPGKAAAKKLAKRKRPLALTATVRTGDRIASSGATLTR